MAYNLELYNDIRSAVITARELGYSETVIEQLRKCKNAEEISHVMATARNAEY